MPTATLNKNITVLGAAFRQTRSIDDDGAVVKNPSAATMGAAKSGTLTTRTDDNTGTLTMSSGHGITTGAVLDVYWTESGVSKSRAGMTVGTVATNSVPIDGGTGDNLPAAQTAVTAMVPRLETFVVTAANLQGLFVGVPGVPVCAVFRKSGPTAELTVRTTSTQDYIWDAGDGSTAPFDEDLVDVYLSHGSTTARQVNCIATVT